MSNIEPEPPKKSKKGQGVCSLFQELHEYLGACCGLTSNSGDGTEINTNVQRPNRHFVRLYTFVLFPYFGFYLLHPSFLS